ncbi:MAG: NHL repeat-containing protein [Deltaproteobacteria bacterium]|nr:NHL repeat-containing protein [Deltaproteobacteria bacterium]
MMGSSPDTDLEFATLVLGQKHFEEAENNSGASGSNATASSLSSPRNVFFDGTKLFVADTQNNRVLIWNTAPTVSQAAATVVIGQADMNATSANQGGTQADRNTLFLPRAVHVKGGKVYIADTGNNRVLVYDSIPTANNANADRVIGHANFTESESNRLDNSTTGVRDDTLNEPSDVYHNGDKLFVADTGNNRVLIYNSVGLTSSQASVVVGQPDTEKADIRQAAANTVKSPNGVFATSNLSIDKLLIADTGNNRILIFNSLPTSDNTSANIVMGQASMADAGSGTSRTTLSSPVDIFQDEGSEQFLIADSGNHRVVVFDSLPGANGASASRVLGQKDFTSAGANRNGKIDGNTLNTPRGVYTNGGLIWIADTQNHRVLRFPAK